MRAKVTEIQVGGTELFSSLSEACKSLARLEKLGFVPKINFSIQLPDGIVKTITIRDDAKGTMAYGDFEGLPDFLEYARDELGDS